MGVEVWIDDGELGAEMTCCDLIEIYAVCYLSGSQGCGVLATKIGERPARRQIYLYLRICSCMVGKGLTRTRNLLYGIRKK